MSLKAFDLQLLVGRENIMGNKPKVTIESLEMTGKNLYIGASDGTLYHFLLLEDVAQGNVDQISKGPQASAFLQAQKRIMTKKSIVQIKAATELKCLLLNSDGLIQAYSMLDLSPSFAMLSRLKNVNRFHVNNHPIHANPFSVEICVSYLKKKNVQLYQVQEDSITPLKEISFSESPISLALDGHYMCIGSTSGYFIFDIDSNTRQDLLPAGENRLYVQRVAPAEFLLAGPNALGIFVTSAGVSQRAPIQWSETVFQASLVHPYVVAMDEEYITVHSVVDQQQKQTLPFQGGLLLLKNEDKLIVCTNKDVFILNLVPFEKQIANLLNQKKVQEAMDLAKECRKCMPRPKFHELMQTTCRKAGFIYFKFLEFEEAEKMFDAGRIDIREVISLFPSMLPSDSTFIRNVPPYHDIANVFEMCARYQESIDKCFDFLASFIIRHPLASRSSDTNSEGSSNPFRQKPLEETPEYRSDIFRSYINIFAKQHMTGNLLTLFQGEHKPVSTSVPARSPFFYEFRHYSEEIVKILTEYQCFHARAVYSILSDDLDQAMNTWRELASKRKSDVDFPGVMCVAEMLGRYCTDTNLLWEHSGWILDIDQEAGVSIFTTFLPQYDEEMAGTENTEISCYPKADDVINFLHRYPEPVVRYLEHLVFVRRIQKEKYHTHLAALYSKHVLELKEKSEKEDALMAERKKLQRILKESNLYRITLILGKVKDTDLYEETVILYGKLGEHEKALDILINKIKDRTAAEEYCMEQSTDFESKKELFERLLSVYLSKVSAGSGKSSKSTMAVVDILNKYAEYYDAQKVMNVLPKAWSIALLNQFLSRTMRLKMHRVDTSRLQQALERSENNSIRREHIEILNKSVRITEDKICEVCNRLFQDSEYVVYPNGVAVHPHCGNNKFVCPVTGQLFKTLPLPKR